MSDIKWIKIVTDIFDDEKMLLIDSLPHRDSVIVIWFKILCLAGKINNSGVLTLNGKMPFTDEMLAKVFRRPVNTVRLALNAFKEYGMIEIVEDVITIPNWEKHQNLTAMESEKEKSRKRVAAYRERQKLLVQKGGGDDVMECNGEGNVTVTECNAADKDKIRIDKNRKEEEKEKEKDKKKDIEFGQEKGSLDFAGVSAEDYPTIPEFEMENEVDGATLKRAFSSVSYCIDENSVRSAMTGALMWCSGKECEIAGASGVTMSLYKFNADFGKMRIIIPKKSLKIISDYAGKCGKIYFSVRDNLASFGDETTRIITRTISGEFIDYSKIISPSRSFGEASVNRESFSEILELVNTICTERDRKAVELDFGSGGIGIKMATSLGRMENHLDCNCPKECKAAFNPRYLYEMVTHTDAENITLHIGGSTTPMLIADGNGYEAVVMPVRLK